MFLFTSNKLVGSKLEVLETKLNLFERLSKEMVTSLNGAVEKIGDANQTISKCLVSHEERLKQSEKVDNDTRSEINQLKKEIKIQMDEHEEKDRADHKELFNEIKNIDTKIEESDKFRFKLTGALILASFLIGAGMVNLFVQPNKNIQIESRLERIEKDVQKDVGIQSR
jgi:seryl-tRNA synthetase